MRSVFVALVGLTFSCAHMQRVDKILGKVCDFPGHEFDSAQFITVDEVDPPEFKEMVRAGAIYWNSYLKRDMLVYEPLLPADTERPAWIVVRIASVSDQEDWNLTTAARATVSNSALHPECIYGAVIKVDPNVYYSLYGRDEASNRLLRRIIHEIGHAIGIDHSWQEGTVMYKGGGTQLKMGDDTLEELKRLYMEPANNKQNNKIKESENGKT